MTKRTLYQCFNARVKGDNIHCAKGHAIGTANSGVLGVRYLSKGAPLELAICQECADYDEMGGPIPPQERGWRGKGKQFHMPRKL